ncbi:hypothetical protein J2X24_004274 [Asticcacaulis solisilvae]|uniref:hypothetical protein n=1 Tax=Asticcacaulis solisilvae TaxID=1217274 RepID=UPI001AE5BE18|nr:hypothetical protein [Asticcacaulis solisilvae]MBP2161689.1 hypothetical protein [Asticcacaulis solisilvae]MDR6802686.1 hypothetical protein [Asticcacaulis sp. BE141]
MAPWANAFATAILLLLVFGGAFAMFGFKFNGFAWAFTLTTSAMMPDLVAETVE